MHENQPCVRYWIRPGVSFCTKIRYSVHSIKEVCYLKTVYSRGIYSIRGIDRSFVELQRE